MTKLRNAGLAVMIGVFCISGNISHAETQLVEGLLNLGKYWEAGTALKTMAAFGQEGTMHQANLCQAKGVEMLKQERFDIGAYLMKTAAEVNPKLYIKNRNDAFEEGLRLFSQKKYTAGMNVFITAIKFNLGSKYTQGFQEDFDTTFENKVASVLYYNGLTEPEGSASSLTLLASACKYDRSYSEEFSRHLIALFKDKPRDERQRTVDQFDAYINEDSRKILLPDPVWVKVQGTEYAFTGDGLDKVTYVADGLKLKMDWRVRCVAEDSNLLFKLLYGGNFTEHKGEFTLPVKNDITIKKGIEFKIPKGKNLNLWAEMITYP